MYDTLFAAERRSGRVREDAEEMGRFAELQARLATQYRTIFPDRLAERTVVVIPSLSTDPRLLAGIEGVRHYEERMLCMLLLLRLPRTRLIFVSSLPVAPWIVDYYLHLLPGIPSGHARKRLQLFSCHDASLRPLSRKILERPRLLRRIHRAIRDPASAHMSCFHSTNLERELALRLDVPIYGCDPALDSLGSKSGSREVFAAAGVSCPDGEENLHHENEVAAALASLVRHHPDLRRAVVKLNYGTSGDGNALLSFADVYGEAAKAASLDRCEAVRRMRSALPTSLRFATPDETWERFSHRLEEMGGIVEAYVETGGIRSPSVQCRVDPLGEVEIISTHDQILGGLSGQKFLGSTFPADAAYRRQITDAGRRVGDELARRGVLGRFGVDFVVRPDAGEAGGWAVDALEINLRKGGTTHTFMMLEFLTDGALDPETGVFRVRSGEERCYYATDNLSSPAYRGLLPEDLIDIAVEHDLHFHVATQEGVMFHLIGALSEHGKLGVVCVAPTLDEAHGLFAHTTRVLDSETARPQ